jgi:hypothetical protein
MDQDVMELVEVVEHDPSGRIKKYLKSKICRSEASSIRAQARLRAEEAKCAEMLKEADAVIQKAHDPLPTHAQLVEKARRPSLPVTGSDVPALPPPVARQVQAPTLPAPQLPQPSPSPAAAIVMHYHVPAPTHRALPAAVPKRQTHQAWVDATAEKARKRKQKMLEPKSSPSPAIAAAQAKAAEEHKAVVAKIGYSIGQQMFEIVAKAVPEDAKRFSVDAAWFQQVARDTALDLVKRGRINGDDSDISMFYVALQLGLDAEMASRKFTRAEDNKA